jgi:hypothetical protein
VEEGIDWGQGADGRESFGVVSERGKGDIRVQTLRKRWMSWHSARI